MNQNHAPVAGRLSQLPPIRLFWEGSQFAHHSFSHVNREVCLELLQCDGLDTTLLVREMARLRETDGFDPSSTPRFAPLIAALARNKVLPSEDDGSTRIWVRHQFPLTRIRPPQADWVIYHPWEYSQSLVPMVEIMIKAREIWTTSVFSQDSIARSGVPLEKIHVIPNGVNLNVYEPSGPRAEVPEAKRFRFLFVGGTIPRKGVDVLLQAYARAFTSADPVSLVIKDYGGDTFYRGLNSENIIREFMHNPGNPHVVYLSDFRTNAEMAALFRACDVFVSSYRGEGFCLPALEAMACGLPVIVTAGGSTDDFVSAQDGWRIPATLRRVEKNPFPMPFVGECHLLEPEVEALSELLREAFQNENLRRAKGTNAALSAQNWTWRHAAEKIRARCQSLAGTIEAKISA